MVLVSLLMKVQYTFIFVRLAITFSQGSADFMKAGAMGLGGISKSISKKCPDAEDKPPLCHRVSCRFKISELADIIQHILPSQNNHNITDAGRNIHIQTVKCG